MKTNQLALAKQYLSTKRYEAAEELLNEILIKNTEDAETVLLLVKIFNDTSRYNLAIELIEKWLSKHNKNGSLLCELSIAYSATEDDEKALNAIKEAVILDPKNYFNHFMLASLFEKKGLYDKAESAYLKSLQLNDSFGPSYKNLIDIKKIKSSDKALLEMAEKALAKNPLDYHKLFIHFSLGKAYDDLHQWKDAFHHFNEGNRLHHEPVDLSSQKKLHKKVSEFFQAIQEEKIKIIPCLDKTPIFIVGMPRSGSTLLEQILSSHPDIETVGESPFIHNKIIKPLFFPLNKTCSETLSEFDPEKLHFISQKYIDLLKGNHPKAHFVIDKSPGNFIYTGLLQALFPNATFIHTTRHPLDTSLSCYFKPFSQIPWSYNLNNIAECYIFYRQCIKNWQSSLPENTFYDVQYETLVQNLELEVKKITELCGIPYNSSCLDFYNTNKTINTASHWQVRQPLYTSSIKRWQHYAKDIKPLAEKLSIFLSPEDNKYLLLASNSKNQEKPTSFYLSFKKHLKKLYNPSKAT